MESSGYIYLLDENGEHHFNSKEEYDAYRKNKYSDREKYPILCETCKYDSIETCPMMIGFKNEEDIKLWEEKYNSLRLFGNAISCTYYNKK